MDLIKFQKILETAENTKKRLFKVSEENESKNAKIPIEINSLQSEFDKTINELNELGQRLQPENFEQISLNIKKYKDINDELDNELQNKLNQEDNSVKLKIKKDIEKMVLELRRNTEKLKYIEGCIKSEYEVVEDTQKLCENKDFNSWSNFKISSDPGFLKLLASETKEYSEIKKKIENPEKTKNNEKK